MRVWRVRWWIRVASVLVLAGLLAQYADTVRRVASGQLPGTEARDGLIVLAVVALLSGGVLSIPVCGYRLTDR
jgi:hypothetical protein